MKKNRAEIFFLLLSLVIFLFLIFSGRLGFHFLGKEEPQPVPPPELLFGFPVDSFRIVEGTLRPNGNLGIILSEFGVGPQQIDLLSRNSEGVFDLRKMKSGQNFYLFQSRDTSKSACYLVYEKDMVEYVIFNLKDSLNITLGKKNVRVELKSATGIIETNLWNTIKDNNLNMMLALELSRIYQWSVDFFGIQKGDRFRCLYDEQFVDSTSVGIGPVYAAEFEHAGKSYRAFRYFQDKQFDYFTEEGENLRKAFLKAPLSFYRISSGFSASRFHPILKIRRPHFGIDYAAPRGTPVVSIGDGTVTEKSHQRGGAGNYLKIRHNSEYSTTYMHLSGFGKGIAKGAHVNQGDVIGYVGSTGLATGPHLDFRVFRGGMPVDPLKIESPPSDPVKAEYRAEFEYIRDSLQQLLLKAVWPSR